MNDHSPSILPVLTSRTLPGFTGISDIVLPSYDGFSIASLPHTISLLLDAPSFGAPALDDRIQQNLGGPYQHVIFVLIDGFGLELFNKVILQAHGHSPAAPVWNRILHEADFFPLTSVIPSTTTTALTSLWTGQYPAEHGIIGYEMWLKEFSLIANMISLSAASFSNDTGGLQRAGFQPDTFLTAPRFGTHLAQNGIWVSAHQPQAITGSGLSTMLMPAPHVFQIPYRTQNDLCVTLNSTVAIHKDQPTFHFIYSSDVDDLCHRYSPKDERVILEIASFGMMIERSINFLRKHKCGNTLLLITADHGHISTPPNPAYSLKNHPLLMQNLIMVPTCENRLPFLFVRSGREQEMLDYVDKTWPGVFHLFRSEQLIQAGLLGNGNLHSGLFDRLGDWIAVPTGDAYWWWANKDNPLLGRHGGLSSGEMIVPLIALRIKKLNALFGRSIHSNLSP